MQYRPRHRHFHCFLVGAADQITTSPISIISISLLVHWVVEDRAQDLKGFLKRKSIGILYANRTNFIVLSLWFGFVFSLCSVESTRQFYVPMLTPLTSIVGSFFLNNNKDSSLRFKPWALPLAIIAVFL